MKIFKELKMCVHDALQWTSILPITTHDNIEYTVTWIKQLLGMNEWVNEQKYNPALNAAPDLFLLALTDVPNFATFWPMIVVCIYVT